MNRRNKLECCHRQAFPNSCNVTLWLCGPIYNWRLVYIARATRQNLEMISSLLRRPRWPREAVMWLSLQGILKGEVSLYHWPPVWLVFLSAVWQKTFFYAKQTNPNQSNGRSMVQWYLPLWHSLIAGIIEWKHILSVVIVRCFSQACLCLPC